MTGLKESARRRSALSAARRSSRIRWTAVLLLALSSAYALVFFEPQILFAHKIRVGNVALHARNPLSTRAIEIAAAAGERLRRSPFYNAKDVYDVFLCDRALLFDLFALWHHRVGGLAQVYLGGNIFLRPANIEHDRLIGPSGIETPGDRTLTYFIAHELTHTAVARRVGRFHYFRLAQWQQEGYSDYVGKAGAFDFLSTLKAFKADEPSLDPHRSGLYLRYHLLVAYLLEDKGWTPEQLLSKSVDPAPIENELRNLRGD